MLCRHTASVLRMLRSSSTMRTRVACCAVTGPSSQRTPSRESTGLLSGDPRWTPEGPVEREVDEEDVDARLAQHEQVARLDPALDHGPYPIFRDAAGPGDARRLPERCLRRDVRIEPAGGGRDELRGNGSGRVRVVVEEPIEVLLDPVAQGLRGGAQIRAGRAGSIPSSLPRGGRTRLQIGVPGEGLPDELGADDPSPLVAYQASLCPGREQDVGDAGRQERIEEPGEDEGDGRRAQRDD